MGTSPQMNAAPFTQAFRGFLILLIRFLLSIYHELQRSYCFKKPSLCAKSEPAITRTPISPSTRQTLQGACSVCSCGRTVPVLGSFMST